MESAILAEFLQDVNLLECPFPLGKELMRPAHVVQLQLRSVSGQCLWAESQATAVETIFAMQMIPPMLTLLRI